MKFRATIPEDPNEPIKAGLAEWLGVIIVGSYFLLSLILTSAKVYMLNKIFYTKKKIN
jgi:hypothetical protein